MFWLSKRRRRRLAERPVPPEWLPIIERNVPYFRLLSTEEQRELLGLLQIFLAEKHFEAVGDLDMTDEIRVTIGVQACLLLLGRETEIYPNLQSVVVYPGAYVAPDSYIEADGTVAEVSEVRDGESWARGAVALSWEDVLRGASNITDGENLVLHEFAHQLDEESGDADGAPVLPSSSMYAEWARVLGREYDRIVRDVERDRRTFLDEYAAESPAEFFAVATEFFFEKPVQLKSKHPELYEQLRAYYRQDPAARSPRVADGRRKASVALTRRPAGPRRRGGR
jgi:Mlc titration factor MtfA (ptsG expression regulator)